MYICRVDGVTLAPSTRCASCVDGRRGGAVKNVFEGPFLLFDVAFTMGVMKHRRKPGISSKEGQKWWRQLISRPLMWDLRWCGAWRVDGARRWATEASTPSSRRDAAMER